MDQLLQDLFGHQAWADAEGWKALITPVSLQEKIFIPWFKEPPLTITVAQAMTQAAMHSHSHRA